MHGGMERVWFPIGQMLLTLALFQTVLDDATTAWGIKVERVEM